MAAHLICTVCGEEPQMDTGTRCEGCQRVFNALRTRDASRPGTEKRTAPTLARLKAAILGGEWLPAPKLRQAKHNGKREPLPRDPEVEAALGVLRDAKGAREGHQGYVYLIIESTQGFDGFRYGKVGFSTNPKARVAELQCGNPRSLALHCMKKGTPDDEAALHVKYIEFNALQEWFHITKELLLEFDLDPEGIPYAKHIHHHRSLA